MAKPNGVILYQGPSLLDGSPIVVIATGLARKTRNGKTNDMIQTWIMRADIAPHEAVKSGADSAVCGDCILRPANKAKRIALFGAKSKPCYVKVWQAPFAVFKAFQRGSYARTDAAGIARVGADRKVRIGSYGDPAAVPVWVWEALAKDSTGWTGYTHQWRNSPALARFCMASVHTYGEALESRAKGFRYFRVSQGAEKLNPGEFMCPASKEAGQKTDCASCGACMGLAAKAKASAVIPQH